jgi:hypothetical protein
MALLVHLRHSWFSTQNAQISPMREEALASLPGYAITRDTLYIITLINPDADCLF